MHRIAYLIDTMEKQIDFQELPWDTALECWKEIIVEAVASLNIITDRDAMVSFQEGKWSPKQIIGHLIDSAANNHQRFVRAQLTDELVFPGYAQEEWVQVQDYQKADWPALIELWRDYNLHLHYVCTRIPDHVLTKPRTEHNLDEIAWQTIPKLKPVTLEYFIRDYIGHLFHHLLQIFPNKEFLLQP